MMIKNKLTGQLIESLQPLCSD